MSGSSTFAGDLANRFTSQMQEERQLKGSLNFDTETFFVDSMRPRIEAWAVTTLTEQARWPFFQTRATSRFLKL
jgi:hypothetical protein